MKQYKSYATGGHPIFMHFNSVYAGCVDI